jgi:hypothetical protein
MNPRIITQKAAHAITNSHPFIALFLSYIEAYHIKITINIRKSNPRAWAIDVVCIRITRNRDLYVGSC